MLDALLTNASQLSHLAVLVAAVLAYLMGWVWYSPLLFGNLFIKLSKIDFKAMQGKSMVPTMLGGFFLQWAMAYALAFLVWGVSVDWQEALGLTVFVWFGFVIPQQVGGLLWDNKPWGLFFLNSAHYLASYLLMALVLTLWS